MDMDPVIFIDPGVGRMWEPQGEGKILTHTDPAGDGADKITHKDFARGTTDYNPYCGVSFTGNAKCFAYCIDDGVLKALSNLSDSNVKRCHLKVKLTVYFEDLAPQNFFVGFIKTKAETFSTSNCYLGIRTVGNAKYTTDKPSTITYAEDNTGNAGHVEFTAGELHNISLAICKNSGEWTLGVAVDGNYSKFVGTDSDMPNSELHFGIYFPTNAQYHISNVIVCYKSAFSGTSDAEQTDIIPPETHLAVLDLSAPDDDEDTTFKPDTEKEGEWIGKANGDNLYQTVDVYELTQSLITEGNSNVSVPANPTDAERKAFVEGYGSDVEIGTIVLYGVPAYKSKYFSRKVKGTYNKSSTREGFGEISMNDTDTYCIDLQQHDKTLKDIHGKSVGWRVSDY